MTKDNGTYRRSEVDESETWAAEAVFVDIAAWQQERESLAAEIQKVSMYGDSFLESPEALARYWHFTEGIHRRLSTLCFYAAMNAAVDSLNESFKPLSGQAQRLVTQMSEASAFEAPALLAKGKETLLAWIKDSESLQKYEKHIQNLFRMQKYVKSEEIEAVLGIIGEPFSAAKGIAGELTDSDLTFPNATSSSGETLVVNQSTIELAKGHPDREIRKSAWEHYADQHLAFKNTLAASYLTSVKQSTALAQIRGYENVLQMKLFQSTIPPEVFSSLIATYKKHLPIWHRYWEVRRKALGYQEIHPYDLWAPLSEKAPRVTWEQSIDWIAGGLQVLGDDYVSTLKRGALEERWVDRAINSGKRQGAFSYGTYDTAPYIMMSYSEDLASMSTLAHELGHSMHSYYSVANQPYVNSGYTLFVAEVASNMNQALTRAYLFEEKHGDRDFQLALIQEAMDNFHRYFFIMPTLACFEDEVHTLVASGEAVTAEVLSTVMARLFTAGYGETMTDDPVRSGITWAQFGHLYEPFYTFQYATGISAAHAIASRILAGESGAREQYLEFLSLGSSEDPIDALKIAGVDMSTGRAVEETFSVLSTLVDRLENLL